MTGGRLGDNPVLSPIPPDHTDRCQAYRKAWRERYGSCTRKICCCSTGDDDD